MFLSLCIYATIFIWHWDVKSFSFWGFYLCLECICSIASFELLSLWWNGTQNLAFGLLFRHAQFERALFLEQIKFLIPQITHDLFLVNRVFFCADDNSLQFLIFFPLKGLYFMDGDILIHHIRENLTNRNYILPFLSKVGA